MAKSDARKMLEQELKDIEDDKSFWEKYNAHIVTGTASAAAAIAAAYGLDKKQALAIIKVAEESLGGSIGGSGFDGGLGGGDEGLGGGMGGSGFSGGL